MDAARLIVGGIYFWSGIQKLNLRFFTEIFPWFTESLWQPFGDTGVYLVIFIVLIALFVPFIEALIAIGFFVRRFRSLAITGSILMFITVMIGVGPFGNNWNISVWPWNIAMLGMVFILFSSFKLNFTEFVSRLRKNKLAWIVIFIFWVVPAGNFVGITDNYLSWSLYSGTVPEASILGNQFFLTSLSPLAKDDELLFKHWTTDELNLVPYPENRVFIDIFEQLCNRYNPQPITLIIKSYSVRNIESVRSYECNEY